MKAHAVMDRSERLERARGVLLITLARRGDGLTGLADLRQEGCLKVRFPRPSGWPADGVEAVMINASGGIAGGDTLGVSLCVGAGCTGSFASQAAERFYRVVPGHPTSVLRTRVDVAAGGFAEWLPQESIVFDQAGLDRRLDISLAADARFLGVEMLVFGRLAMGESVQAARICDTISLRRDGWLIWQDGLRFDGDVQHALARAAIGGGARAMATLVYAGPDATLMLDAVRGALSPFEAGVSLLEGVLTARILAPDGDMLRQAVLAALALLRHGRPLPRVWAL